ncbi:MAG TPA: EF-P lysine aminoacylase EpmA [Steroidobacteraceae bacterium]|nr:EF-P lysine aminoacylase EpmA [Steroidobacteraceae bacterium]
MSGRGADWAPSASRATLERRAALLERARGFFRERGVLEVDTPVVVNAAVTDVHVHSARVELPGSPRALYLHTSPEYAMKRLLAAGSGDIFQICHVARGFEVSRLHNPEFTLIEWYRVGFSLDALMSEVELLVHALLPPPPSGRSAERLTYRDAFARALGVDALGAPTSELVRLAQASGYRSAQPVSGASAAPERDELLELLMALRVGPELGRGGLTFVHRYPVSQAALARVDPADPRVALRFELYCEGIELANGFAELADPREQRERFERERRERRRRGLPDVEPDERLLAALGALPECAGVAVGFDRVAMLASGASRIAEVLPFPTERA